MNKSIVKKMARPAQGTPPPLAPTAVLARAMRRACDKTADIDVHIADATGKELPIEDALNLVAANDLAIEMSKGDRLVGCAVISEDLRAAIVESLTMGVVNENSAQSRPSSGADAALCTPVIQYFLDEAREVTDGTSIDGWLEALSLGQRLASTRILELSLTDETLGVVEVVCKLVGTKREGRLLLILPIPMEEAAEAGAHNEDWVKLWRPVAEEVSANLEAVLHRLVLGLAKVEEFRAGDVLPLYGAKVTGVRLVDTSGAVVAKGRLGQLNGHRALRIEPAPQEHMRELADLPATQELGFPDIDAGLGIEAGFPDVMGDTTVDAESLDLNNGFPDAEPSFSDTSSFDAPDMLADSSTDSFDLPEQGNDIPEISLDPDMQFDAATQESGTELPELDSEGIMDLSIDLPAADIELPTAPLDLDTELDLPAPPLDLDIDLPDLD